MAPAYHRSGPLSPLKVVLAWFLPVTTRDGDRIRPLTGRMTVVRRGGKRARKRYLSATEAAHFRGRSVYPMCFQYEERNETYPVSCHRGFPGGPLAAGHAFGSGGFHLGEYANPGRGARSGQRHITRRPGRLDTAAPDDRAADSEPDRSESVHPGHQYSR